MNNEKLQVLFVKLFLVFGVSWLTESIHYFLIITKETKIVQEFDSNMQEQCKNDVEELFFRVGSAYNLLRGVFLFVIFGCKKVVWRQFKKTVGIKSKSHSDKAGSNTRVTYTTQNSNTSCEQ